MSVYSTMYITRADCIGAIRKAISGNAGDHGALAEELSAAEPGFHLRGLYGLSDGQLEELLFRLVGDDWLNNFIIVQEYRRGSDHLSYRPHKEPHVGTAGGGSAANLAKAALDSMTDDDRLEVIRSYCVHCGSRNPRCKCWNDD